MAVRPAGADSLQAAAETSWIKMSLVSASFCGHRDPGLRLRFRRVVGKSVQEGNDACVGGGNTEGNGSGDGKGNHYCNQ
jgi:hypothetical protein